MPDCKTDQRTVCAKRLQREQQMLAQPSPSWKQSSDGAVAAWPRSILALQIGVGLRNTRCTSSRRTRDEQTLPAPRGKITRTLFKAKKYQLLIFAVVGLGG